MSSPIDSWERVDGGEQRTNGRVREGEGGSDGGVEEDGMDGRRGEERRGCCSLE